MKNLSTFTVLAIFTLSACQSSSNEEELLRKENELLKREVELQKREAEMQPRTTKKSEVPKAVNKPNIERIDGSYKFGTSTLILKRFEDGSLDVQLDMASQSCTMGPAIGTFSRKGPNIYKGKLRDGVDNSDFTGVYTIKVNGKKAELIRTSTREHTFEFGASCFVEGVYTLR